MNKIILMGAIVLFASHAYTFQSNHSQEFLLDRFELDQEQESSACDDLFTYSCGENSRHSEVIKEYKELNKEIESKLIGFKNQYGKGLKHESFIALLDAKLKEIDVSLATELKEDQLNKLYTLDYLYLDSSTIKLPWNCDEDPIVVDTIVSESSSEEELDSLVDSVHRVAEKFKAAIRNYLEHNPIEFLLYVESDICSSKIDGDASKSDFCRNLPLNRLLLDFRRSQILGRESVDFKDLTDGLISLMLGVNLQTLDSSVSKEANLENLKNLTSKYKICRDYQSLIHGQATAVIKSMNKKSHRSEVFVKGVHSLYYNEANQQAFFSMFAELKEDIFWFFKENMSSSEHVERALTSLSGLRLSWPKLPNDALYTKEPNGQRYLRMDEIDKRDMSNLLYQLLSSDSLGGLTTINAFYTPITTTGAGVTSETINFFPIFAYMMKSFPVAVRQVMGHEIGHRFDPNQSVANGFDLSFEFSQLVSCWKKDSSISLNSDQNGEAVSDFIAANLIAKYAQGETLEEKQRIVSRSAAAHCIFSEEPSGFETDGPHPSPILRVGGILGANPAVREVLECRGPSRYFQTCGLDKIGL